MIHHTSQQNSISCHAAMTSHPTATPTPPQPLPPWPRNHPLSSQTIRESPVLPRDIRLPPSPPSDREDDFVAIYQRSFVLSRTDSDESVSPLHSTLQLPDRSRNSSPSYLAVRPHTSGGLSTLPMQRAHSSPGVDSSGRFITPNPHSLRRPSSPLSPGRRRSPMRGAMEETYSASWSGLNMEPNIPENEELNLSLMHDGDSGRLSPLPSYHNTFPRSRRRPTSPLHQSASSPSLSTTARSLSPYLGGASFSTWTTPKYVNEPYPSYPFSATSSVPSTPTSIRSRSPSISSLDTIEDTPDAEEAARLEDEESRQRGEDSDSGTESRRRSSFDQRGMVLRSNKERKRWSVCGAERRADFSLEPIKE